MKSSRVVHIGVVLLKLGLFHGQWLCDGKVLDLPTL
jgi:hypothetical protein